MFVCFIMYNSVVWLIIALFLYRYSVCLWCYQQWQDSHNACKLLSVYPLSCHAPTCPLVHFFMNFMRARCSLIVGPAIRGCPQIDALMPTLPFSHCFHIVSSELCVVVVVSCMYCYPQCQRFRGWQREEEKDKERAYLIGQQFFSNTRTKG